MTNPTNKTYITDKSTDTVLFKIRRKLDNKYFSAHNTWGDEKYAKILFNNHSVTSTILSNFFRDTNLEDIEIVHYLCDPTYQQSADSWKNASESKFKQKIKRAKGLRGLLVAVIMKGEFQPKEKDKPFIIIKRNEKGWVDADFLISTIKDLTRELLEDIVILGNDKYLKKIVFNKEETAVKVVDPDPIQPIDPILLDRPNRPNPKFNPLVNPEKQ